MRSHLILSGALLLAGCASGVRHVQASEPLQRQQKWALLPVQNRAETPQAGERAESLLAMLLRVRGVDDLQLYPAPAATADELTPGERQRFEAALEWARKTGFSYGVTGSVNEWHYRSGQDGDPAVGLELEVIDLRTGKVIWSASGARSGWGSDTVSGTAEKLIDELVAQMEVR